MKSIRLEDVENYIHKKRKVTLEELTEVFDVSMNTVRRDIKELLKKETIKKVYGGVESLKNEEEDIYLNDFKNRKKKNMTEKEKIAKIAAEFIKDGDTIFIDSGSTTVSILDNVDSDISLTVVTNSLDVIIKVSKFSNINLLVPASFYKKKTRSFIEFDTQTDNVLDRLNIDKCFMAASSISKEQGVMNATTAEYVIKNKVMKRSLKKYLLVDKTKYGKTSFITYAEIKEFDAVITDGIPNEYKEIFEKHNIKTQIVE